MTTTTRRQPATPPPTMDLRDLPIDTVQPNPWNRKHFDQAALQELAESIRAQGLLQPIVVRALPPTVRGPKQPYQIVAGERRWRAAQLAGLGTIAATLRALTDLEVLEVLAIENDQREDVTPLEQAAYYRQLLEQSDGRYDVRAIASKVGRAPSYVYERLKLTDLTTEAQTLLERATITPAQAMLLARLQPDDQEAAIAEFAGITGKWLGTTRELEAWIGDQVNRALGSVAFDVADAELVPAAGPCTTCPKRSGYAPDLFPDLRKGDVCMDRACLETKLTAHLARQQAKYKAQGEPLARIATTHTKRNGGVAPHNWTAAKKSTPGATRAIVVAGPDVGKLKWVKVDKPQPKPKPRANRLSDPDACAREEKIRKAVLAERVPEFRTVIEAIADEITVSDEIALFLGRAISTSELVQWVVNGRESSQLKDWDIQDDLETALIADAPGEWKKGTFLRNTNPLDATAARYVVAIQIWLSRDASAHEKNLKAHIAARIRDEATQRKAAQRSSTALNTAQRTSTKKKATTKKTTTTTPSAKRKKPTPQFMKPLQPDAVLAAIVGSQARPRFELVKSVWLYIKKHKLHDSKNPRMIIADEKLRPLFGGADQVSIFAMTKCITLHISEVV